MSKKELLFSLNSKDFRFDYYRGTGAGGQHRNKTDSACRCVHEPSGAIGQAEDTRSQHKNKQLAFLRMAASTKFRAWMRLEVARRTGALREAQERVDREMRTNIKVEVQENGRWVPERQTDR